MNEVSELTAREKQLIRELTQIISEINLHDKTLKETVFRGIASYVAGIKVGLNFQRNCD